MIIKEENRDLFTVPQGYYLAHCISGDFALGAGIAKQFTEIYNMKEKLIKNYGGFVFVSSGQALLIDNVFNLVTKEKCYQKPTLKSLEEALEDMKDQMESLTITKLAIPQIGAGLDRLNWDEVKALVEKVFEETNIEILICYI